MKFRCVKLNWRFPIFLFIFWACTSISHQNQQLSNQISKRVWTKLEYSFEMSCVSMPNRTIEYCGWDRNSETDRKSTISINFNATVSTKPVPGYTVNQAALLDGECMVKIERVSPQDVTLWNCTVMIAEHKTPYLGTVEVVLSKKPTSPEILNKYCFKTMLDGENGAGNSTVNVTCCTKGGVPSPELTLSFDNQTVMTSGDDIGNHDCLYWPKVKFNWTDHEKEIKCNAAHDEYLDSEITEDSVELNILYAPKIIDHQLANLPNDSTFIHFIKSNLTEIKSINVTFSANPEATVGWIFPPNVTDALNFTKELQKISKWKWLSILTLNISKMTEGSSMNFQLHLRNKFGLRILKFELIRSSGHTQPTKLPSWMWLFFVIIGAVLFQIFIVCGFFLCRRNSRLCFSGRSGQMVLSPRTRRRKWAAGNVDMELRQIDQTSPEVTIPLMELNKNLRPGDVGWVTPTNYDWRYPGDSIQAESDSDADAIAARQESVQIRFHATSHGFEREPARRPQKPSTNLSQSS